ncbi:MAG: cytochrome P450 [Sulfitobacter sp.]
MFTLSSPPDGFIEDPFPFYDQLLDQTPVCPQPDGSFLICKHADLSAIYRDTNIYVSDKKTAFGPKFGQGSALYEHHTTSLVFNDPPLHTRVRRIMTAALTPKALARMEPGLIDVVDQLLDTMPREPDLIDDFAATIPVQIIGNLLDVPMAERGPLRDWSLAILGALEPTLTQTQLEQGNRAVSEFKTYLQDLIARRKATPGDPDTDVLTRLIFGDSHGELTENELIHNCIFILNAGHETTTNLIGSSLALLHDHPDQRAKLARDPSLVTSCIEEVLRFRSPNQFGNRETTRPVAIGGYEIPAGTNLHLCIGAANRDPEVFDNPTHFDITRHPNRHLAFAGGPHVCVGLTLARMEGRIAIDRFLKKYPKFSLSPSRTYGRRIRFHGPAHLPTRLF